MSEMVTARAGPKIVEDLPQVHREMVHVVRLAVIEGRRAYESANNRSEGNAPLMGASTHRNAIWRSLQLMIVVEDVLLKRRIPSSATNAGRTTTPESRGADWPPRYQDNAQLGTSGAHKHFLRRADSCPLI
jgi:hypothetical protein